MRLIRIEEANTCEMGPVGKKVPLLSFQWGCWTYSSGIDAGNIAGKSALVAQW